MTHHTFPQKLYVHEPLGSDANYDAYPTWEDAEPDDTIAIYELKTVCRVRERKSRELVSEESFRKGKNIVIDGLKEVPRS